MQTLLALDSRGAQQLEKLTLLRAKTDLHLHLQVEKMGSPEHFKCIGQYCISPITGI